MQTDAKLVIELSSNWQTWHYCWLRIARNCTKSKRKSVKNPRAPSGITPDACGHKHWANKWRLCTQCETKRKTAAELVIELTNLTLLFTQDRTKLYKKWTECVKNPRAPVGITPDACGHKLRASKYRLCTQYENFARTDPKRITKLTNLTPLLTLNRTKLYKKWTEMCKKSPGACGHNPGRMRA